MSHAPGSAGRRQAAFWDNKSEVRSLLLLLLSALAIAQPDELALESRRAKQFMAQGRFAEAIEIYERLNQAVPNNPGLLLNLGMAEHLAGKNREAIRHLEAVLKLQPQAFPALIMLGASHLRLAEPAKAVRPLEKAVALQPSDPEPRQMLADALMMIERWEQASNHLRKLADADANSAKTWFSLGRCYEALAQQSFAALGKSAPGSAWWLALAGEARLKERRFTSAFALYREAAAKMPNLRGSHAALAEIYRETNHADWAAVEEDTEKKLPRPDCAAKPAECHFDAGRHHEAIAAAKARPGAESLYWRARAHNQLALQAFTRLGKLPPSAELHELLAEMHRNQGRHRDSVKEWEEALKLSPGDDRIEQELAQSVYLSRDYPRAEPLLRKALTKLPGSAELNFFLGDTLLNTQRSEEAVPLLRKAVELDSKLLPAQATLGRALVASGQAKEAIPHLKAALSADTDGSLHYQLSRAYQAEGQPALSVEFLMKYQELQRAARAGGEEASITPP